VTDPRFKRKTWTHELVIQSKEMGRFKLYLAIGEEKGIPIEIWLDCAKAGTMLREFMHSWAACFSLALQGDVSLAKLVKLYREWKFEPCGRVEGSDGVLECASIPSLVVRILERDYLGRFR
jgi:hypothetical protein